MTIQVERPVIPATPINSEQSLDEAFADLDIEIVESGPAADKLFRATDDGCGATCQSACTSCD